MGGEVSMALTRITQDHIGFAVRDIHKALDWYAKVLGFTRLLPPGICKMDLMGHQGYRCIIQNDQGVCLELEQRTDQPFPTNSSPIISHFCLQADGIETMQDHLKEHGIIPKDENWIVDKGVVKILYFTGMDNIRIELIQHIK
jgi:catechol 2,3-dioxygenase-like lactoylglutathione lyase family enzyme